MQRFEYAVSIAPEDGRYVVRCRDFPQLEATGNDIDGAIALAEAGIETIFTDYMRAGKYLPRPSKPLKRECLIAPAAGTVAKAALHLAMEEAGITKVQLAKRLDVDEKEVRRMLDPRCKSKLPRIAQAIGLLGRKLIIRLELT